MENKIPLIRYWNGVPLTECSKEVLIEVIDWLAKEREELLVSNKKYSIQSVYDAAEIGKLNGQLEKSSFQFNC